MLGWGIGILYHGFVIATIKLIPQNWLNILLFAITQGGNLNFWDIQQLISSEGKIPFINLPLGPPCWTSDLRPI